MILQYIIHNDSSTLSFNIDTESVLGLTEIFTMCMHLFQADTEIKCFSLGF